MTVTEIRQFVQRAAALGNRGDLDSLAKLFDPHVVMRGPEGTVTGAEAVRAAFQVLYTAFPDLHVEFETLIVEDDWVAYTANATGTHRGPLQLADGRAFPATNKSITLPVVNMRQIKDGRLTRIVNSYDRMQLLGQLGFLASPGVRTQSSVSAPRTSP